MKNMTNKASIKTAGSAMRATRSVPLTNNQPLKPRLAIKKAPVFFAVFCIGTAVIVQQNYSDITGYLNRPVTKVRMENQWQKVGEAETSSLLAPYMGMGFFDFDVRGVKQTLENHPWIARASVKRVWPDSLSLQLTEQIAIAQWGEDRLLNQRGEIFQPRRASELGLPQLNGPLDTQYEVMEQYQLMNPILFSSGLRLTGLSLSARGSWQLVLNNELSVTVGRADMTDKLKKFTAFYDSQPAEESALFESVDLRYGNGIAVRNRAQELMGVAVR